MIKTVAFDLGGVYFTDGTRLVAGNWAESYGVDAEKVVYELRHTREAVALRAGGMNFEGFWENFRNIMKIDVGDDELLEDWFSSYRVNKEVPTLLDELSQLGLELLYLTNTVPGRDDFLDRKFNFLRHFRGGVSSTIAGFKKPDERIYERMHELTASRGKEVVFVDDKEKNLAPARKLGWHAIKFENTQQLRHELKELGVTIR